jgi:hypothetical protein
MFLRQMAVVMASIAMMGWAATVRASDAAPRTSSAVQAPIVLVGGGSYYGGMYRGFYTPNFNRGGGPAALGTYGGGRPGMYPPGSYRSNRSYSRQPVTRTAPR